MRIFSNYKVILITIFSIAIFATKLFTPFTFVLLTSLINGGEQLQPTLRLHTLQGR